MYCTSDGLNIHRLGDIETVIIKGIHYSPALCTSILVRTGLANLSIVSLNVESSHCRVLLLYYLNSRHETSNVDIVGHRLQRRGTCVDTEWCSTIYSRLQVIQN